MTGALPKYKCEAVAAQITRQLNITPALHWREVQDYYAPRLFGPGLFWLDRYDKDMRALIRKQLDREGAYLHVWTP